jgi:hypothetical protein
MKEKNYKMSPQFITNEKGEKISVILPIKEYLKLLEAIEENEDIQLYDEVKARNEKRISFEDYLKSRKKRNHATL